MLKVYHSVCRKCMKVYYSVCRKCIIVYEGVYIEDKNEMIIIQLHFGEATCLNHISVLGATTLLLVCNLYGIISNAVLE